MHPAAPAWEIQVTTIITVRDPHGSVHHETVASADYSASIREQIATGMLDAKPRAIIAAVATAVAAATSVALAAA